MQGWWRGEWEHLCGKKILIRVLIWVIQQSMLSTSLHNSRAPRREPHTSRLWLDRDGGRKDSGERLLLQERLQHTHVGLLLQRRWLQPRLCPHRRHLPPALRCSRRLPEGGILAFLSLPLAFLTPPPPPPPRSYLVF